MQSRLGGATFADHKSAKAWTQTEIFSPSLPQAKGHTMALTCGYSDCAEHRPLAPSADGDGRPQRRNASNYFPPECRKLCADHVQPPPRQGRALPSGDSFREKALHLVRQLPTK
jgi:hypothetical protein